MPPRHFILICLACLTALPACSKSPGAKTAEKKTKTDAKSEANVSFDKDIKPLLAQYCYDCHGEKKQKADLALHTYRDEKSIEKDRKTWTTVLNNVRGRVMPPEDKPQPTQAQRDLLSEWIEVTVFKSDCNHPDPGRVTLRRLNREEYNNTVRDLLGVNFEPAADFPADDSGYGFDNIGDVLSLPPVLLEKYVAAAEKIMDAVIFTDLTPRRKTTRIESAKMEAKGGYAGGGLRVLSGKGELGTPFTAAKAGEYIFQIMSSTRQVGPEAARMNISLDGRLIKTAPVTGSSDAGAIVEARTILQPGQHRLLLTLANPFTAPPDSKGRKRDRGFAVDYVDVLAPGDPPELTEMQKKIFAPEAGVADKEQRALAIIKTFGARAFRRPVADEEMSRYLKFVTMAEKEKETFEKGIKLACEAMLVSPNFLFRGEIQPEPNNPKSVHAVNDYALAARLSYFLWSSMPDDELFREAGAKTLRKNLDAQVRRMLKDPKALALVENFAGQWLQIRNLAIAQPDPGTFPAFDEKLRAAMVKETETYFEHIMREDRNLLEFLDSNYTFVNERLAKHYGIPGVTGEAFTRVVLTNAARGGVLTHGSVLLLTSNPTRTSPVKRGKWVLENLLGTPPPPPPPEVPDLDKPDGGKQLTGSLRQRMEQHREDPNCATCHARMDPIGFGLENFDGIGAWRGKDGEFKIEPSGKLVSGENFSGPADLRAILLLKKSENFSRCISEKMLTYALGRGLEFYDKCAVDQISKNVKARGYKFSVLISEIVHSTPFQMRRGEGEHVTMAGN
ncbi:MAG: DUF1592 domain-containing protein [Verrucomicrobia bacterium]|nr:DUF1592 domain-containing protein [Verrucomicrobiota bacterium]